VGTSVGAVVGYGVGAVVGKVLGCVLGACGNAFIFPFSHVHTSDV
jgi:hypothetical protein